MKGRKTQHRQSSALHHSDGDSYVGALVCATPQGNVARPACVGDAAGRLVVVTGASLLGAWLRNATWDSFLDPQRPSKHELRECHCYDNQVRLVGRCFWCSTVV